METYEDVLSESAEKTYIFVFTMTKDPDSKDWSITEIQDYDSVANGKEIAETNTEAAVLRVAVLSPRRLSRPPPKRQGKKTRKRLSLKKLIQKLRAMLLLIPK